jgi:hypothetical protein
MSTKLDVISNFSKNGCYEDAANFIKIPCSNGLFEQIKKEENIYKNTFDKQLQFPKGSWRFYPASKLFVFRDKGKIPHFGYTEVSPYFYPSDPLIHTYHHVKLYFNTKEKPSTLNAALEIKGISPDKIYIIPDNILEKLMEERKTIMERLRVDTNYLELKNKKIFNLHYDLNLIFNRK